MTAPGYHGWTHRPKYLGGTDPIPPFTAWASVYFTNTDTPQTIAAGNSAFLTWASFETNARQLFWTNSDGGDVKNNTAGDDTLVCSEYGVLLATLVAEFEADTVGYEHSIQIQRSRQRGTWLSEYSESPATADGGLYGGLTRPVGDVSIGIHEYWDYLPAQYAAFHVAAINGDLSNARDVTRAHLTVVLLPTAPRNRTYTIF